MTTSVRIGARAVTEIQIMYRLNIHNVWIAMLPGLLFAGASWMNVSPGGGGVVWMLIVAAWTYLFAYINDTCDQSTGVEEDRINKPQRPAPAGLTDGRGLRRRFMIGSALFLIIGAVAGWMALICSVGWVVTLIVARYLMNPHNYFLWKPVTMWAGAVCQLAGAWCLVSPLTPTAIAWVFIVASMFVIGMPIEDIRDIPGDRATGRRSLAIMFGGPVVCSVFSLLMIAWPFIGAMLILPGGIASFPELAAIAVLAGFCLCAAILALRFNSVAAQRAAYIVYSFAHVAVAALPMVYLLSHSVSV